MSESKSFSDAQARRDLDSVLDAAVATGEARIERKDGRSFIVRLARKSPLDVPAVDLGFHSADEVVQLLRDERESPRSWEKEVPVLPKKLSRLPSPVRRKTARSKP